MVIHLNYIFDGCVAIFGLYVAFRIFRSAKQIKNTRLLPPAGWFIAGVLAAGSSMTTSSATAVLIYMATYWLSNLSGGDMPPVESPSPTSTKDDNDRNA